MTVTFDDQGFATSEGYIRAHFIGDHNEYTHSDDFFVCTGTGIPNYLTLNNPPILAENEVAILKNGKWEKQIDSRGLYYQKSTAEPKLITTLAPVPDDLTRTAPPKPNCRFTFNETTQTWEKWPEDVLNEELSWRKREISWCASLLDQIRNDEEIGVKTYCKPYTAKELHDYRIELINYKDSPEFPEGPRPFI